MSYAQILILVLIATVIRHVETPEAKACVLLGALLGVLGGMAEPSSASVRGARGPSA